jgi:hypothetical protein
VNDNYATEFGVVSLSTKELNSLPEPERNFLITASFIVNDIRFHWAMMSRSPVDKSGTDLSSMQMVRWLWCSRKLASVIYEAEIALSNYCGQIPLLKDISKGSHPVLSKDSRKSKYYGIAKNLRNSVTNHYSTDGMVGSLERFDDGVTHRIFAHQMRGNSVSELSEQIYTLPLLNNGDADTNLEEFNDWCQKGSASILEFCDHATGRILISAFPDRTHEIHTIKVGLEAASVDQVWPLFLKLD